MAAAAQLTCFCRALCVKARSVPFLSSCACGGNPIRSKRTTLPEHLACVACVCFRVCSEFPSRSLSLVEKTTYRFLQIISRGKQNPALHISQANQAKTEYTRKWVALFSCQAALVSASFKQLYFCQHQSDSYSRTSQDLLTGIMRTTQKTLHGDPYQVVQFRRSLEV